MITSITFDNSEVLAWPLPNDADGVNHRRECAIRARIYAYRRLVALAITFTDITTDYTEDPRSVTIHVDHPNPGDSTAISNGIKDSPIAIAVNDFRYDPPLNLDPGTTSEPGLTAQYAAEWEVNISNQAEEAAMIAAVTGFEGMTKSEIDTFIDNATTPQLKTILKMLVYSNITGRKLRSAQV